MAITQWADEYGARAYVNMASPVIYSISSASQTISFPTTSLTATGTGGSGKHSYRLGRACLYKGNTLLDYIFTNTTASTNLGTYASASWEDTYVITTSDYFNTSNPTERVVPLTIKAVGNSATYDYITYLQAGSSTSTDNIHAPSTYTLATLNLTLNAPPTFSSTQVSFTNDYDGDAYAGLTTASVTISGSSAQYGGTISASSLTIGNQTVTGSGNGTISILLDSAGTFTPTVTVTDSRGQTTTKTLDAITVNSYVAPEVAFTLERTNSSGTVDDEGTYAVATASFNWTDAIATLSQPTVSAIDSDGTTLSVSATWYTDRAFTTAVDWSSTSSWSSPKTLYGRIGTLPVNESSQVTITPNDSEGSGTAQTQTLASAFYTIDFLAGGHGIAFGQPASEEGFFCNMDSHFSDNAHVMRALFDFVYPVGSYYETSDTTFDPNVTWGGTWALETEGQVHVSSGTNYAVSGALTNTSDGGEENHTLTVNELAKHSHRILQANNSGTAGTWVTNASTTNTRKVAYQGGQTYSDVIELSGGSQPHNIMQPYIVVNRWHRTA